MKALMSSSFCTVIIVTHNSELFIHRTLKCLNEQTKKPHHIIIVDSHSQDATYLNEYKAKEGMTILFSKQNLGFCKGNDYGASFVPKETKYILFLNPDAFVTPTFIEDSLAIMEGESYANCAALTGTMLGYDIELDKPTGKYDSTGIFPTWYGKWFDRNQGEAYHPSHYLSIEEVPAICGALMFCRKKALDEVKNSQKDYFDRSFFMYKEDIDLSQRLIKKGWKLLFCPSLTAYHCRGWRKRSAMPRHLKMLSARNELKLHLRLKSPVKILYSLAKYTAVLCFGV